MVVPKGSRPGEGNGCGGGGGDTLWCLLMAELDATLKNHRWLGVFSFSVQKHYDRVSVWQERITKNIFLSPYFSVFVQTEYPPLEC